jgi:hypothetical protein
MREGDGMKEYRLKDGRTVLLRELSGKDDPRRILRYINSLIGESTYILIDRRVSLSKEREWLKSKLSAVKKGDSICLVIEDRGDIVGILHGDREPFKMRNNVVIGIALLPAYRGQVLGATSLIESGRR